MSDDERDSLDGLHGGDDGEPEFDTYNYVHEYGSGISSSHLTRMQHLSASAQRAHERLQPVRRARTTSPDDDGANRVRGLMPPLPLLVKGSTPSPSPWRSRSPRHASDSKRSQATAHDDSPCDAGSDLATPTPKRPANAGNQLPAVKTPSPGASRAPHKDPPPTYHEVQRRREAQVEAVARKYNAATGVITQIETYDTIHKEFSGDRSYVTPAAMRKQQRFEQEMAGKLEKFLAHEEKRQTAVKGRLLKEAEDRQQEWLAVVVTAQAAALFIRSVRVARARKVLREHFVVRFVAYVRRKHALEVRALKIREREAKMVAPPSRAVLRNIECLACLPDAALDKIIAGMTRRCHLPNEFLVHEGQIGTEALVLQEGAVRILPQRRPPASLGTAGAHLRLQPQTSLANLNQPGFVIGETVLLAEEPYECGIAALQETDVWVLSRALFLEVVSSVSDSAIQETVARLADERRAVNMLRYRVLSQSFVRTASPLFTLWSQAGVAKVLKCVRPTIFRRGDVVVAQGQLGRALIFIVQGRVELLVDGKRTETIREGQAVAEVSVALGKRDKKTSVRALTNCDCWILDRSDYAGIVAHEPLTHTMPAIMALVDENGKERERSQRSKLTTDETSPSA